MDITYLGHSAFRLKGKNATVIMDPFDKKVGFSFPSVSADLVTVSHHHPDHDATGAVDGTSRRAKPYIVEAPGEYEVGGVGVFGWSSYHDDHEGAERGKNTIYVVHIDGVRVGHLGDLGHTLSEKQVEDLGTIDVLLVPVGGFYTINAAAAVEVINAIQPYYVVPMHYKTEKHSAEMFAQVSGVEPFLKEMGVEGLQPVEKLKVDPDTLPEGTEVVLLSS